MKIGCLLSAREKATRLPKKVLLDVAGKPVTLFLLERISMAQCISQVILATSTHPDDKVLTELAKQGGFACFCGSEDDKLARYYQAALEFELDAVIIVDGDDPFCFPEFIDLVATELQKGDADCIYLSGLPLGAASTGLTTEALRRVLEMKDENDTEVWGGYFIDSNYFRSREIRVNDPLFNHPKIRLTLDYQEDYELVKQIVKSFNGNIKFTSNDLMDLLVNRRPELTLINTEAQERYETHLKKCKPVKLKNTYNNYKIMVIGLGSMGKRRIRNLLACGISKENIIGIDKRTDRTSEALEKYGIFVRNNIHDEDMRTIQAIVISTPPDQHLIYAQLAVKHDKHMFIEASVLIDGLADLADQVALKNLVAFPSCTMRFFAGPRRISELIKEGTIGKVFAWQYQSGQYLPDWHPWEDVTEFYVSNPITGGCREIVPFEITWLESVFGKIIEVDSQHNKLSNMPVDIDDIYMLQLRHKGEVYGQLMVDVLSRTPIRNLRITGSNGTLEWDDTAKHIRLFQTLTNEWLIENLGHGTVESQYINPEEPYIEEIRTFLNCARKNIQPTYTLSNDMDTLKLLYAAETANRERKRIRTS